MDFLAKDTQQINQLMKLSEIVEALDATVLACEEKLDIEVKTCGASDLMSDILAALSEGCILLTGLDGSR